MKKLKVAIIGCGRISVCYSDAFLKLSDLMELTYAVDADAKKAKDFAAAFFKSFSSTPLCSTFS